MNGIEVAGIWDKKCPSEESESAHRKKTDLIITLSPVGATANYMQILRNNGNPFTTGGPIDLNRVYLETASCIFKETTKIINVTGEPMQLTIECDYKTLNVFGVCHRICVVGICNKVNLNGNLHSVLFDGYTNEVTFRTDTLGGKCAIWGENPPMNYALGETNGTYLINTGPKPEKMEFNDKLSDGQRHRFTWKPSPSIDAETFIKENEKGPEPESIEEPVEWTEPETMDDWVDYDDDMDSTYESETE